MTTRTSAAFYFSRSWKALLTGSLIAIVSVVLACREHRPEYAVIGGSVLTILGIPLTFLRLLRRGPAGVDDPDPPATLPLQPGAKGVQFNTEHMWASVARIVENFSVITGVVFLICGTLLAGVVAPILAMICAVR